MGWGSFLCRFIWVCLWFPLSPASGNLSWEDRYQPARSHPLCTCQDNSRVSVSSWTCLYNSKVFLLLLACPCNTGSLCRAVVWLYRISVSNNVELGTSRKTGTPWGREGHQHCDAAPIGSLWRASGGLFYLEHTLFSTGNVHSLLATLTEWILKQ